MTYTRPSRLYRLLADAPRPLFRVTAEDGTVWEDDELTEISIHRGSGDLVGSVTPSTASIGVPHRVAVKSGAHVTITLGPWFAAWIRDRGADPNLGVFGRFTGRIGRQTVTDYTAMKQTTIVEAASWTAQLARAAQTTALNTDDDVSTAIKALMEPAFLASRITVNSHYSGDYLAFSEPAATYKDTIDSLTSDIGVLVADHRNGRQLIKPIPWRLADAQARLATEYPLIRSQAISPATWTQPNEGVPPTYRGQWRNSTGGISELYAGPNPADTFVSDVDWTHVQINTDQWEWLYGLRAQGFETDYRIETLKIDVLRLLASDIPVHRYVAAQLLGAEVGDPVFFSLDWPNPVRGIYWLTSIDERITSREWEMSITVAPYRSLAGDLTPTVPARVWDSALYSWDSETRAWDET